MQSKRPSMATVCESGKQNNFITEGRNTDQHSDHQDDEHGQATQNYYMTSDDNSSKKLVLNVNNIVNDIKNDLPIFAKVIIENKKFNMQIDTRAGLSACSLEFYKLNFVKNDLVSSDIVLKGYSAEKILIKYQE